MHTAKLSDIGSNLTTLTYLKSWWTVHPIWYFSTIGYFALMAFCMVAELFDDRLLYGVSVWTKPFKFALSLAVYFATLVLFAKLLPAGYFSTWRGKVLTAIPFLAGLGEMAYITLQAALGEASHFNTSTPYHALMYSLMGFGATLLVAILVWMAWTIARSNNMNHPLVLSIVVGLGLTFLLGGGFGGYLGSQGGHWVGGVQSDANTVALLNWARDGGDLRVAHFFGMHAMQIIPLFGLLITQAMYKNWLPRHFAIAMVIAFSAAYTAFSWATFSQAIQGQPFLL